MDANKKTIALMIALGACARLLPHPWNFTPMVALGLYAGAKCARIGFGMLATLVTLVASDIALGFMQGPEYSFYEGMWYVYAASMISVAAGSLIRRRGGVSPGVTPIVAGGLAASVLFFVTTNFMLWATGTLYPHTPAGLATCFAAAIPFYQNQLAGDVFYVAALFGGHALMERLTRPTLRAA